MPRIQKRRLLIVDGYNVLNAWRPQLAQSSATTLADAREALAEKLLDYAGFSGQTVVLVYDAWMSQRAKRTEEVTGPLTVIYTRKGETADQYIEKLCAQNAQNAQLGLVEMRVATSDSIEQTIALGRGATRLSARELINEIDQASRAVRTALPAHRSAKSTLMDRVSAETRMRLEKLRRGE